MGAKTGSDVKSLTGLLLSAEEVTTPGVLSVLLVCVCMCVLCSEDLFVSCCVFVTQRSNSDQQENILSPHPFLYQIFISSDLT